MTDKKSLSNQLGYYVGEYIVHRYLPTLSCDMGQTRTIIEVSIDDESEHNRLEDNWHKKVWANNRDTNAAKEEWEEYQAFRKVLIEKYLPEKLECPLPVLLLDEMDIQLFKEGLGVSLWDCDMSYYSCNPEDIEIVLPKDKFDRVTIYLKRD